MEFKRGQPTLAQQTINGYTYTPGIITRWCPLSPNRTRLGQGLSGDWQYRLEEYANPARHLVGPPIPKRDLNRRAHRVYKPQMEAYYLPKLRGFLDAVAPAAVNMYDFCEALSHGRSRRLHVHTEVAIYRALIALFDRGGYEWIEVDEWYLSPPSMWNPGGPYVGHGPTTKYRKVPNKGGRPPMVPPGSPPLARARLRMKRAMQNAKPEKGCIPRSSTDSLMEPST